MLVKEGQVGDGVIRTVQLSTQVAPCRGVLRIRRGTKCNAELLQGPQQRSLVAQRGISHAAVPPRHFERHVRRTRLQLLCLSHERCNLAAKDGPRLYAFVEQQTPPITAFAIHQHETTKGFLSQAVSLRHCRGLTCRTVASWAGNNTRRVRVSAGESGSKAFAMRGG